MNAQPLTGHDRRVLQAQLGRPPRGEIYVASRCPYGEVEVVATAPLLDGDEPFPTLYWLTCPVLVQRGRDAWRRAICANGCAPGWGRRPSPGSSGQAEAEYLEERREMARALGMEETEALFRGRDGVGGGPAGNLKCLHAHYAHWRARGTNPVGREMSSLMEDAYKKRATALPGLHCDAQAIFKKAGPS